MAVSTSYTTTRITNEVKCNSPEQHTTRAGQPDETPQNRSSRTKEAQRAQQDTQQRLGHESPCCNVYIQDHQSQHVACRTMGQKQERRQPASHIHRKTAGVGGGETHTRPPLHDEGRQKDTDHVGLPNWAERRNRHTNTHTHTHTQTHTTNTQPTHNHHTHTHNHHTTITQPSHNQPKVSTENPISSAMGMADICIHQYRMTRRGRMREMQTQPGSQVGTHNIVAGRHGITAFHNALEDSPAAGNSGRERGWPGAM